MKPQKDLASLGKKIVTQVERVPKEILDGFKGISSTAVADVVGKLYTMDAAIHQLNKPERAIVGTAVTVRCPPGDNLMTHAALSYLQEGDILVCDARGDREYALGGALVCSIAKRRGAVGFVLDGAYRDSDELEERVDFPVYALTLQAKPPQKVGPGEINTPIYCGKVPVNPGDIVIADSQGIAVVPQEYAEAALAAVKARAAKDEKRWNDIEGWDREHTGIFDKSVVDHGIVIE